MLIENEYISFDYVIMYINVKVIFSQDPIDIYPFHVITHQWSFEKAVLWYNFHQLCFTRGNFH